MKRLALSALVIALAACGSFGVQPRTLSLAYKPGDTYNYKFHSSTKQTIVMSGQTLPTQIDITANESAKVNSVDAAGTADLTITFSDFTVKSVAGGVTNTTTGLPNNSTDVKISADGTISSIDGSHMAAANPMAGFSGFGGGFFITAVLPDHPVKPGDKWSKTYDQAIPAKFLTGGSHITSDSTYLRDESLNGVTAAVVETKSTGTIDIKDSQGTSQTSTGGVTVKGTFTMDVTTWIDPSGHRIMKSHGSAHDDGTIDFPAMTAGSQPALPFMGPITATGDSTTDLNPA